MRTSPQRPRPLVSRLASLAVVLALMLVVLGLSGCTSPAKDLPAPTGSPRTLLFRQQDGSTSQVDVADNAGVLMGYARNDAKAPVAGVRITLSHVDDAQVTSSTGQFVFENLAARTYELTAKADDFLIAKADIPVKAGVVARAVITLEPKDASLEHDPIAPTPDLLKTGSGSGGLPAQANSQSASTARVPMVEVPVWVALAAVSLLVAAVVLLSWRLRRGLPSHLIVQGRAALSAGRAVQAESLARRALSRRPSDSDAWILLGATLIKRGQLSEAIRQLERASQLYDPQMAGIAFLITLAYKRIGQPDAARRWLPLVARDEGYWDALNLDPDLALKSWLSKGVLPRPSDPAYS